MLFHNNGNGTFSNITNKAGVAAPNWSTCATWFDYDNDSKLDLFVSGFVQYSGTGTILCGDNRVGRRYYCVPRVFMPRSSFLFHNEGGGRFVDVSRDSGIADGGVAYSDAGAPRSGMGVDAADFSNDG